MAVPITFTGKPHHSYVPKEHNTTPNLQIRICNEGLEIMTEEITHYVESDKWTTKTIWVVVPWNDPAITKLRDALNKQGDA